MSIKDGGEFWKEVAQRLNEIDGTRFDVRRRAPDKFNHLPRRNPAVKVLPIVKRASRVSVRKRN